MNSLRPRPLGFLAALALLPACGGGGPAGPVPQTPPPATALSATDGLSGAPVAASFTPASGSRGQVVTAVAAGYHTRATHVPADGVLPLWPETLMPEAYLLPMVYSDFVPRERLSMREQPLTVSARGGLLSQRTVALRFREVQSEVERLTGLPVVESASGNVEVSIDPRDPEILDGALAVTYNTYRGNVITRSRVVFRALENLTGIGAYRSNTMLHEFGHVLGLGHSPHRDDVMSIVRNRSTRHAYGVREASCLSMAYGHRRPGNMFPDSDVDLVPQDVGTLTIAIVD